MAQTPTAASLPRGAAVHEAPRLVDCIEAPYAYVHLDCLPPVDGAAANAEGGPVQRLLADPSLDLVLGGGADNGGGSRSLSLVRGMLRSGVGELELVMTGIVAKAGQPLLVLRARLQHARAVQLGDNLVASSDLATPYRRVGDHQTYCLRGNASSGPGELVELALIGDDLVVGNDGSAMGEVLAPQVGTSAVDGRRVLAADPRFQALRGRLELPRGSLLLYADWQRLGRRLQSTMRGAPAHLLGSSGLGSARSIMMTLAPSASAGDERDFAATVLLDLATGAPADGQRGGAGSSGIDGWLEAAQPIAARSLLPELPRGGLGGLVLSVDLAAVAAFSPRSAHMVWDLREAFTGFGLDFDRSVLGRLGARGTVQLHFAPITDDVGADNAAAGDARQRPGPDAAFAAVSPVYSLRAKSKRAAQDLFGDVHRVVKRNELGELVEFKDDKGRRVDVLVLRGRAHEFTASVAVHDDSLLVAEDPSMLVQALSELRVGKKPRGRREQLIESSIQAIGGERVAGLFDLDLSPLFQRIAAAIGDVSSADADRSSLPSLSSLPRRHVGYVDLDRRDGRTVVRIRVLSSR